MLTEEERRLRKKKSNGVFKIFERDIPKMLNRQNGECFWCSCKLDKYHIDHVIPLIKGGRHSIGNIVASCQSAILSRMINC